MDRFTVQSVMPENRRGNNLYYICDTLTSDSMYVRRTNHKYSFVGMMEEKAERLVKIYECEQFFCEDPSDSAALLKFAISIVQSTLRLGGEMGI